jgi:hypothetical protein
MSAITPSSDCYDHPHYIAAICCGVLGVISLGLFSFCWRVAGEGDFRIRNAVYGLAGFLALAACLWFIYQALSLAYFGVSPCASIPPAHQWNPNHLASLAVHL